jgi:hypothetical protein
LEEGKEYNSFKTKRSFKMNLLQKWFENKENKVLRKMLLLEEHQLRKRFSSIEVPVVSYGSKICNAKFEIVDDKQKLIMSFNDCDSPTKCGEMYITRSGEDMLIKRSGKSVNVKKELITQLMGKFENIIFEYQEDEETRYSHFIKNLVAGNYKIKENTLVSEGIQAGKEIVLTTNQGIDLIFSWEPKSLLIKVKDSVLLYLRSLEYSMEQENFVNAKVRKLNITREEKEDLIGFVKSFIDSKDIEMLFSEEEILLSEIYA